MVLHHQVFLEILAKGTLGLVRFAKLTIVEGLTPGVVQQLSPLLIVPARRGEFQVAGSSGGRRVTTVGHRGFGKGGGLLQTGPGGPVPQGAGSEEFPVFDLIREDFCPIGPLDWVFGDQPSEEFGYFWGDFGVVWDFDVFFFNDHDQLSDVVAFEGAEPEQHPEEHHSQRPNIGFDTVFVPLEHLRSHVNRRTQHRLRNLVLTLQRLAKPEVSQLDDSLVQQQVFGLQVAVHDVVPVEYFEGFQDLCEEGESRVFGEGSSFFEEFLEGTTVAVLIDEVEVVDGFEHVEVLDDVGTGLEVGQDADFIVGAFFQFGVLFELLCLHHFDGHLLFGLDVDCLVDRRVHPPPDLVLQRVILNHFSHLPSNKLTITTSEQTLPSTPPTRSTPLRKFINRASNQMQGQQSLLSRDASISASTLDLLKALSVAISASTRDLLTASSAAKRDAASSASTLDLLKALSVATRSASISAATRDRRRAASVSSLDAANSAASLDLLRAFSEATLSAATSASTLDLLRAASVATCASTLDLESAASVAALEAASSAASLERLRADSVSRAALQLNGG